MKSIIKIASFCTIIAGVCAANAATSRLSIAGKPATRLPTISTIAGTVKTTGTVTTTTTTSSTTSLLNNIECIDAYTSCIKGADVCGPELEECTTNVLFHAKMPSCLNVLAQCTTSGINDLFGTTATTALSTVSETNSYGEVTRYTYPTDGSILGQMITGAHISNLLDKEQCVRRYTNCLKRDTVCGDDFELCTTDAEFKKQYIFCESTLARCQSDGKKELFGSTNTSVAPSSTSRLGVAISEGAKLAALNAVNTCQRVVDSCFVNACRSNPWRCVEGTNMTVVELADVIAGGQLDSATATTSALSVNGDGSITSNVDLYSMTGQDVRKFFKAACSETIGANKYCHMTFREKIPTKRELADIDTQEDVFSLAYAARKESANVKLQEILKKFDTTAKDKCVDTIKSCAMRSCGRGLGSLCYKQVFGNGGAKTINGKKTYDEIKTGCAAIVNTDANCQYAAVSSNGDLYSYAYTDNTAFSILFPEEGTDADPIGVVATLNASLATSYNEAAIADMKKKCSNTAISCVKSMCGSDYTNCYRNRTDVISGTYQTGDAKFNRSMNKMGGVLDYNIVIGLCMNTVKNAKTCEEHLKIAAEDFRGEYADGDSWGDNGSVRDAWWGANSTSVNKNADNVLIGCRVSDDDAKSNTACDNYSVGECGYIDEDGCNYSVEVYQNESEYVLENAGKTLFQEILRDVEKEVQAKYNAKLTNEQNVCLANNNGGIRGSSDNGSTFMWVKLRSNKIPKDYQNKGLKPNKFVASNDLYGSFCRARITVTSDDKDVQELLGDKATAYFAVGDSFVCGSWIDSGTLEKITKKVGERARKEAGEGGARDKAAMAWSTVGGFLAGGIGGFFGMDALQRNGGSLGGLLDGSGITKTKEESENAEKCLDKVADAKSKYRQATNETTDAKKQYNLFLGAVKNAEEALTYARRANAKGISSITFKAIGEYSPTIAGSSATYAYDTGKLARVESVLSDMERRCKAAKSDKATKETATRCLDTVSSLRTRLKNLGTPTSETDFRNLNSIILSVNDAIEACGTSDEVKAEKEQKGYTCVLVKTLKDAGSVLFSDVVDTERDCDCVKQGFDKADTGCRKSKVEPYYETKGSSTPAGICNGIAQLDEVSAESGYIYESTTAVEATGGEAVDETQAFKDFADNIDKLYKACSKVVEGETDEERTKRRNNNLIAGAATSAVGAALGIGISKTVLDVKYQDIQSEAVKQWMEEIGDHIQCYVGLEELGSYGDTIKFEID